MFVDFFFIDILNKTHLFLIIRIIKDEAYECNRNE